MTYCIPGITSTYPNSHVTAIKASPWPEILALIGKEGEKVMIDLVLDCGIFVSVVSGRGSYHQLSGKSSNVMFEASLTIATGEPLGDLPSLIGNNTALATKSRSASSVVKLSTVHSPTSISFVHNRMLYAKAALNSQRKVRFGLRHIRKFSNLR